jgi:imidazoleglycerol phosphate synthase glutamine amidotransferase subunit HisH
MNITRDYGLVNLSSLETALHNQGIVIKITDCMEAIEKAVTIFLPGLRVGAELLRARGEVIG